MRAKPWELPDGSRFFIHCTVVDVLLAGGTRSRARQRWRRHASAPAGALLNRSRRCSRSRAPAAPSLC